jgi:DNA (cytosine-5)-methyltransferase 1
LQLRSRRGKPPPATSRRPAPLLITIGDEPSWRSFPLPSPAAKPVKRASAKAAAKPPAKKPRAEEAEADITVGSGRQAAQNISFKASRVKLESKADRLEVKEEATADTEKEALQETEAGAPSIKTRRLGDFSVVDAAGIAEPVENVGLLDKDLFLSGVIYPKDGTITKDTGRRVAKFGPLRSFAVDLSDAKAGPVVMLSTDAASYACIRPSNAFKKLFARLAEQVEVLAEVHQALTPALGGSAQVTVEEVIARLARSKAAKSYATPREGLMLNAKFVLSQLECLDGETGAKSLKYAETEFAQALDAAAKDYKYVGSQHMRQTNGGIVIARDEPAGGKEGKGGKEGVEEPPADPQMEADEEFARRLQAQIDKAARAPAGGRGGGASKAAYIKVEEAEIADDYPLPAPYKKEEVRFFLFWFCALLA